MTKEKPGLDEFTRQVEHFHGGQSLTPAAAIAAEDFWVYWDALSELISSNSMQVNVDMLRLGLLVPQFKQYQTWKGLGILLALLAFILLFFVWQVSIVILLVGVGVYFYGNHIRHTHGEQFSIDLINEAKRNPMDMGMANLCANYLAGIIELASESGRAHWPQHPSNAVTGDTTLIQTS